MATLDNLLNELRNSNDAGNKTEHSKPAVPSPAKSPSASPKIMSNVGSKLQESFKDRDASLPFTDVGSDSSDVLPVSSVAATRTDCSLAKPVRTSPSIVEPNMRLGLLPKLEKTGSSFPKPDYTGNSLVKLDNEGKMESAETVHKEVLDGCIKVEKQEQQEQEQEQEQEEGNTTDKTLMLQKKLEAEVGRGEGKNKTRDCRYWLLWVLMVLVIPLMILIVFVVMPRVYFMKYHVLETASENRGLPADFADYMAKLGYGRLESLPNDSVKPTITEITVLSSVSPPGGTSSVHDKVPLKEGSSSEVTEASVYLPEDDLQHEPSVEPTEVHVGIQESTDKKILKNASHNLAAVHVAQIKPTILKTVFFSLEKCRRGEDVVLLEYISMYRNLMLFFGSFGGFANIQTQMLDSRIQNLELYTKKRESLQYETLKSMIHYEDTSGKIGSVYPFSGTILFTCLHRHLQFLASSLVNLVYLHPQQSLQEAFRPAYEAALLWHHSWFVERFYLMGMTLLPTKEEALRRLWVTLGEEVSNHALVASLRFVIRELDMVTNLSEDILTDTGALRKIPEEVTI
nr:uncharacterized protein LOC128699840 isoform X2 [Cherax quadricarinatus]XP_053648593.1 uncharacterized protein LOC128699840 isoform X2 [Cherax quadricarinatus]XP_053648594.1 uncharacterized protein LOC128699840 isoform X2 [Cherax quadricarinatus]